MPKLKSLKPVQPASKSSRENRQQTVRMFKTLRDEKYTQSDGSEGSAIISARHCTKAKTVPIRQPKIIARTSRYVCCFECSSDFSEIMCLSICTSLQKTRYSVRKNTRHKVSREGLFLPKFSSIMP